MKYWNTLKEKLEYGNAPECLVKQIMETGIEKQGVTEVEACWVAGCKFIPCLVAGSKTNALRYKKL